jgi:hypothetical protein
LLPNSRAIHVAANYAMDNGGEFFAVLHRKSQGYTDGTSFEESVKQFGVSRNVGLLKICFTVSVFHTNLSDLRTDLMHEYFIVEVESIWKTSQTVVVSTDFL